jgi:hypothetical protein
MRNIFTSILVVIVTLSMPRNTAAQGLSAGFRAGMSNSMDINRLSDGITDRAWEKELFLRYETNKRFAFELGGSRYSNAEAGRWHSSGCLVDYEAIALFAPPTHQNLLTYTSYNMLDISLGAQYNLSCLFREECPVRKVFSSYMGVAAVGTFGKVTTYSTDRRLSDGDVSTTERTGKGMYNLLLGINNTATYSFNRFYLTSVVAYLVSPFAPANGYHNQANPNSKFLLKLGIGYRF